MVPPCRYGRWAPRRPRTTDLMARVERRRDRGLAYKRSSVPPCLFADRGPERCARSASEGQEHGRFSRGPAGHGRRSNPHQWCDRSRSHRRDAGRSAGGLRAGATGGVGLSRSRSFLAVAQRSATLSHQARGDGQADPGCGRDPAGSRAGGGRRHRLFGRDPGPARRRGGRARGGPRPRRVGPGEFAASRCRQRDGGDRLPVRRVVCHGAV